jgi:uncharacterized protein (TIGR03435 family)
VFELMLQSLLADRFKLTLHHESKQAPIYALVVAKDGPKFHETSHDPPSAGLKVGGLPGPLPKGGIWMGRGQISVNGGALGVFAEELSTALDCIVLDRTELKGVFDFTLHWTPDEGRGPALSDSPDGFTPQPDALGPSIFTTLREQLGLKLEPQKGPVDTLVIDHVERPSEN